VRRVRDIAVARIVVGAFNISFHSFPVSTYILCMAFNISFHSFPMSTYILCTEELARKAGKGLLEGKDSTVSVMRTHNIFGLMDLCNVACRWRARLYARGATEHWHQGNVPFHSRKVCARHGSQWGATPGRAGAGQSARRVCGRHEASDAEIRQVCRGPAAAKAARMAFPRLGFFFKDNTCKASMRKCESGVRARH
jgi:hypothetical protein